MDSIKTKKKKKMGTVLNKLNSLNYTIDNEGNLISSIQSKNEKNNNSSSK